MDVLVTSDSKFGSALLRHVLERLGHRVQDTGTAGAGTLLANQLWKADVMVAAVVASTSSRQRYGAVGVEIGIALERGLPILLVGKSGLSLPFLAGIPRVDFADDEDLLQAQIELLLQAVAEGSPREGFSRASAIPPRAVQPKASSAVAHAQAFEQEVGTLLRATGAEVLEQLEMPKGGDRADFTIFFPESANYLGVVLVEAKAMSQTQNRAGAKRQLTDAAKRLSQRVLASRSGLGLLIYEGAVVGVPTTPMTVTLSLAQLQMRLSSGNLEQVLRQARNEAIHAL